MLQKFIEKCDICKRRTNMYKGYPDGRIICDECAKKLEKEQRNKKWR